MKKKKHGPVYKKTSKVMFHAFIIIAAFLIIFPLFRKNSTERKSNDIEKVMDRQLDSMLTANHGSDFSVILKGQIGLVDRENPFLKEIESLKDQIGVFEEIREENDGNSSREIARLTHQCDSLQSLVDTWKPVKAYIRTIMFNTGGKKAMCFQVIEENSRISEEQDFNLMFLNLDKGTE